MGSLFYGGLLGVFVLAFFFKRVGGTGAFAGVLAGEAAIFAVAEFTRVSFLWYNVIGCVLVGLAFGVRDGKGSRTLQLLPLSASLKHNLLRLAMSLYRRLTGVLR